MHGTVAWPPVAKCLVLLLLSSSPEDHAAAAAAATFGRVFFCHAPDCLVDGRVATAMCRGSLPDVSHNVICCGLRREGVTGVTVSELERAGESGDFIYGFLVF